MATKKKSTGSKITYCKTCGKEIAYKTKKPDFCLEHRPAKEYRHTTKRAHNQHLYERAIFKIIEDVIICDAVRNGYFTWLLSPKKEPLQLDWYARCGVEVAFEIQGEQHYEFNKYFHRNQAAFEYQVACDKLKAEQCRKRGVFLFPIRYDTKVNALYLLKLLREAGCLTELIRHNAINAKYLGGEAAQ